MVSIASCNKGHVLMHRIEGLSFHGVRTYSKTYKHTNNFNSIRQTASAKFCLAKHYLRTIYSIPGTYTAY